MIFKVTLRCLNAAHPFTVITLNLMEIHKIEGFNTEKAHYVLLREELKR